MGRMFHRLRLTLLAVLIAVPASPLTLSDLQTKTRVLISDSGTATSRLRFSNSQVTEFLNECQRESIGFAWPITKSTNIELVAGTTYYSLPNTYIATKRVTWRNRVLTEKSQFNLDGQKEWETVSGSPQNYFTAFASRTIIGIYPYPADSTSTGTVKVEFIAQADDLSSSSDVPFNGIREFYPFHHFLSYCAAARMSAIDGEGQLAAFFQQIFVQGLTRLAEASKARPAYSPGVTPGNPGGP